MGAGIAQIAALYGNRVQLHDARFGAADAAKKAIGDALANRVAKGRIGAAEAEAALGRIQTVVTLADVCVARLVIEAIVEDLAAKRELLSSVENVALRAGVHKTTVYRRWPDRETLVADALTDTVAQGVPSPDTGSFEGDLRELWP